jgi:hypothetical protein
MKSVLLLAMLLCLPAVATCGFGFDDDRGTPTPAATYWGWQCADGTVPDPDAGCLPADCEDGSDPSDGTDAGAVCVCADGTQLLSCACQDGGCGSGD